VATLTCALHDDNRIHRERQHRRHCRQAGSRRGLRRRCLKLAGPETLADLAQSLGLKARAATSAQAAAAGDIVVVTIPLGKIDQVLAEPLAGKVVIDTCNYLPRARRRDPRAR